MQSLNAFAVEFGMERITTELEKERIDRIVAKINKLSDDKIKELAVKFWRGPSQYYANVERGFYYQRNIIIKGANGDKGSYSLSDGPDVRPRVKVVDEETIEETSEEKEAPESAETPDKESTPEEKISEPGLAGLMASLPQTSQMWVKPYGNCSRLRITATKQGSGS